MLIYIKNGGFAWLTCKTATWDRHQPGCGKSLENSNFGKHKQIYTGGRIHKCRHSKCVKSFDTKFNLIKLENSKQFPRNLTSQRHHYLWHSSHVIPWNDSEIDLIDFLKSLTDSVLQFHPIFPYFLLDASFLSVKGSKLCWHIRLKEVLYQ